MANLQAGLQVLRKMEQEREDSVGTERGVMSTLLGRLESYCEQVEAVAVEDRRELQGEIEQLRREMAEREASLARESQAMRDALDAATAELAGAQERQASKREETRRDGSSPRGRPSTRKSNTSGVRQATATADAAAAAAAQAQAQRLKEHNENLSIALASARAARTQADATTLAELRKIRAAFRTLHESQARKSAVGRSGGTNGSPRGSPSAGSPRHRDSQDHSLRSEAGMVGPREQTDPSDGLSRQLHGDFGKAAAAGEADSLDGEMPGQLNSGGSLPSSQDRPEPGHNDRQHASDERGGRGADGGMRPALTVSQLGGPFQPQERATDRD